jgi:hypothetical protein
MYETPDNSQRTYFTLHLYLNGEEGEADPLVGGATTFWGMDMKRRLDVQPKMGSILIFQQRYLIHAGDEVVKGTKLTMRTELMYTAEETEEDPEEAAAARAKTDAARTKDLNMKAIWKQIKASRQ